MKLRNQLGVDSRGKKLNLDVEKLFIKGGRHCTEVFQTMSPNCI